MKFYLKNICHLLEFGYIALPQRKWMKSFDPPHKYPRFHIYGYEKDFHKGYKFKIHIDHKPHDKKSAVDTGKKITQEIALLKSKEKDIDIIVKQHRKLISQRNTNQ